MRTTPAPDIEGIVNGGQGRLRRCNTTRIGLAAAAVLLVGGGVYGVTQLGDDGADADVATPPPAPSEAVSVPSYVDVDPDQPVEPGTYRLDVGVDSSGNAIEADITLAGKGWAASNHPVMFDGSFASGLGVYQVEEVAGGSGCSSDHTLTPAASAPDALARQLAGLPRSTVEQRPTPTQVLGRDAVHLRLRIDDICLRNDAAYRPVTTVIGGPRGISYSDTPKDEIVDFWVLDVDGATVVLDLFRPPGTPEDVVQQVRDAHGSITFVTGE